MHSLAAFWSQTSTAQKDMYGQEEECRLVLELLGRDVRQRLRDTQTLAEDSKRLCLIH
jgi:hypothetical protein